MSNKQIIVTQGDYGICIQNNFTKDKTTPLDITGYTVDITTVCPDNTKLERTGQVVIAESGVVEYILMQEDTEQTGLYKMYWRITDLDENITAQNMLTYYVVPVNGGI